MNATVEISASKRLPFSFAKRFGVFCRHNGEVMQLIYKRGVEPSVFNEVRRFLGHNAKFQLLDVDAATFDSELTLAYEQDSDTAMEMVQGLGDELDLVSLANAVPETEDLLEQEDDAPIIRLINAVLTEAVKENASDIHIETFEKNLSVRFRVDGVLREAVQPKRALAALLVSRIKVMAKLDIAEKRVPQDGRISLRIGGREIDVRVSTMPANHGERVVLRLLDKQAGEIELGSLGMRASANAQVSEIIHKPHGIFLVTGPTGSGKSTTLYASLTELNDFSRNILTIEDPVEYDLEGVGQTQVNAKADMTFARGLRAILRQDPDVVMVGEIRDSETAAIAVQASLTGHLVLSTLHTNSAIGAITRLEDMGIEPFMLASSLAGVLGQRLVRVLCPECKEAFEPNAFDRSVLGAQDSEQFVLFRPKGCTECHGRGYRGRTGLYELLEVNDEVKQLIHERAPESEILAAQRDYVPMRDEGVAKVRAGITTVEEILRVTEGH